MAGVVELVGGLAEDDAGLGVGEEPGGDLVGGGAVVGLGAQVGQSVADEDVGESSVAAELEAGLEVAGGVFGFEECPYFVVDE